MDKPRCNKCGCFLSQSKEHICNVWTEEKKLKLSKTIECHTKTNFNRENWTEYYKNKVGDLLL